MICTECYRSNRSPNQGWYMCVVTFFIQGDSLTSKHNNRLFSTKDRDQDAGSTRNCAVVYQGAWWYNDCHDSNLNGLYLNGENDPRSASWYTLRRDYSSLKRIEMKIRPRYWSEGTRYMDWTGPSAVEVLKPTSTLYGLYSNMQLKYRNEGLGYVNNGPSYINCMFSSACTLSGMQTWNWYFRAS